MYSIMSVLPFSIARSKGVFSDILFVPFTVFCPSALGNDSASNLITSNDKDALTAQWSGSSPSNHTKKKNQYIRANEVYCRANEIYRNLKYVHNKAKEICWCIIFIEYAVNLNFEDDDYNQ